MVVTRMCEEGFGSTTALLPPMESVMKRGLFLAGAGGLLTAGCTSGAPALLPGESASARRTAPASLVWSDEFDYAGHPDGTKWAYDVGGGWGNDELEYYTHARLANANVASGVLNVTARREPYEGARYTSARPRRSARTGGIGRTTGSSTSSSTSPWAEAGAACTAPTRASFRARCKSTTCGSTSSAHRSIGGGS
jgi:hypothetical protein